MNPVLFTKSCQVANFIKGNYKQAWKWEDPVGWAMFHLLHGSCFTMLDGDKIAALCVARPVEIPQHGRVMYEFKEGGKCLVIDLLIVPKGIEDGMGIFSVMLEERFGVPERLVFLRTNKLRMRTFPWGKFAKKVRKKERENYG